MDLAIAKIAVPDRMRPPDPARIKSLAESIAELGLINPITVHAESKGAFRLVCGLHRLRAVESLGEDMIEAHLIDAWDDLDLELAEIDENLIRSELTELERSRHLARRKEIFEAKRNNATSCRETPGRPEGFAAETERQTGVDRRTVQRSIARAEKIAPDVQAALSDTPSADRGVELDALARVDHQTQREAVERVRNGQDATVRDAIRFVAGGDPESVESDKKFQRLWKAWLAADEAARGRFREAIDG